MNDSVSTKQLEKMYLIAAEIVQKYGDTYMPAFKRIHEELQIRKELNELKKLACTVASQSPGEP